MLRYTAAWERYVTRQGRWVDFENDYKTMDASYMESVIWAFKTLYDAGSSTKASRVLPYCWECETPLSNFETRRTTRCARRRPGRHRGDHPRSGPRHERPGRRGGARPHLDDDPVDAAVEPTRFTVGTSITYAVYERDGVRYLIGESRAAEYGPELAGAELVGTVAGAELVGRTYRPLFGYFAAEPNAFRVLAADFVTTEEGTGIVHMAPGFGEDDQRLCESAGIAVVCPVDDRGCFDETIPELAGTQVFEANERVIERLGESGSLVRHEEYVHNYPHCWRSDTPLIYRDELVLRRGHRHQGPDGRAEPADPLGSRACRSGSFRQLARGDTGLVDLAQPLLGDPHPGLEERRPRLPPRRRLRQPRRAGGRLRRPPR